MAILQRFSGLFPSSFPTALEKLIINQMNILGGQIEEKLEKKMLDGESIIN